MYIKFICILYCSTIILHSMIQTTGHTALLECFWNTNKNSVGGTFKNSLGMFFFYIYIFVAIFSRRTWILCNYVIIIINM